MAECNCQYFYLGMDCWHKEALGLLGVLGAIGSIRGCIGGLAGSIGTQGPEAV